MILDLLEPEGEFTSVDISEINPEGLGVQEMPCLSGSVSLQTVFIYYFI